jgi:hypothetical protein
MSEQKISNTFEKMRDTIDQYTKVVRQDGALWKSIEEIGGDPAWLNDIKTALDAVYSAIDEADMGARAHLDSQEESADLSEEPNEGNEFSGALAQAKKSGKSEFEVGGKQYKVREGGMFMGAAGTPYPEEDNPVKDAIMQRLSVKYNMADLLTQYGLDRVEAAIDDVASFHDDAEELGSSDISIMVKQVMDNLGATNEGLDYLKKLAGI